jgi:hypothetical protein
VLCATRHWMVAKSEHLGAQGIPHLVLERRRIAER